MVYRSIQEEWQSKTLSYAKSVNAFIECGIRDGWDNVGEAPADPGRDHLVDNVITAIREANKSGRVDSLRELWPPAYEPLVPLLRSNEQYIPVVCVLPDKSIVARIGGTLRREGSAWR